MESQAGGIETARELGVAYGAMGSDGGESGFPPRCTGAGRDPAGVRADDFKCAGR